MTGFITAITMPKWGLTMTEGKVIRWLSAPGQSLAEGQEFLEIETPKITNVVEAPLSGLLRRIVAPAGTTLPVGALLAIIAAESVSEGEIDSFVGDFAVPEPAAEAATNGKAENPRHIDAAGQRMRYLELGAGEGVPVVLLHGFGADLNTWMFTQPALTEGRRAFALDLPGHGGSAKDVGAGDTAQMTQAVEDALSALGIERLHVVGHSMGGAIAASLALRVPERVASLTVIASAGLGPEINGTFIDAFVRASRRRETVEFLNLLVHDPALVSRAMVEDVLRYKRLDGVSAALAKIAEAWFAGSRQKLDLAGQIALLSIPVQVIWGREDRIIPVAHASALGSRFPVHVLEHAGHLPHMEQASEVNRLISEFIQSSPAEVSSS